MVAAFALLGTLRRGRRLPDWFVWHLVAIVGVLLALGSFTPLGHLLVHVPLFGSQRLQSRNIALTDLALAVLLSYWVDHLLDRRSSEEGRSAGTARFGRAEAAALVPVLVTAALAATAAVSPVAVARFVGADAKRVTDATAQRPFLLVSFAFAVVLVVVVVRSGRISPSALARFLVLFCVADLVFFNISSVWSVAPGLPAPVSAGAPGTSAVPLHLTEPIGTSGRFVIDDPASIDEANLHRFGQPDLNLYHQTFSAQGYSSIVDGPYAAATGSHAATGRGTNALSPVALVNGVFDSLDTTTLVTLAADLVVTGSSAPSSPTGRRVVRAGGQARWVFGEQIDISSVSLPWTPEGAGGPPPAIRVAVQRPGGQLAWQQRTLVTAVDGDLVVRFPHPSAGIGLVVADPAPGTLGPAVVRTPEGRSYTASGDLQDALAVDHWTFDGDRGLLAFYSNQQARPPLTLQAVAGGGTDAASVQARSGPRIDPTSAVVSSPHGAEVIRAVAPIPGWSATWSPRGASAARTVVVHRSGVVQAVDVPAGRGVLTWRYTAPGLIAGAWCALAGALVLLGLWLWPVARARIGGRDRGETSAEPG